MFSSGVAGMLGRPDLASNYGSYMATPTSGGGSVGNFGQVATSGGSFMGANLSTSISGNVATGQLSLGLVMAMVVAMLLTYWWTHQHQH
jgi:hypothetical protein